MAKHIHHQFLFESDKIVPSEKAKEFISMWNKADRGGIQQKLAEHFKVSIPTVYRIRIKLRLEPIWSNKHPGRHKLVNRVKRLYRKGYSAERIAKFVKMDAQCVLNMLRRENVEINPKHVTNPKFFKTRCTSMSHTQLLKAIKRLYTEVKLTQEQIAEYLGINPGTVSCKLKAMKITQFRQHHQFLKGGYNCQWCNTYMENVWQNSGPKKQKYCGSSCKSKAKDYRAIIRGKKTCVNQLDMMNDFLKQTWGTDYDRQVKTIMDVTPIMDVTSITPIMEKKNNGNKKCKI